MGPVPVDDGNECFEQFEPGKLLEDSWFFGNLLERKPRTMSRSLSDPCSSSNFNQELLPPAKSFDDAYESINKFPAGKKIGTRKLDRKAFSDKLRRRRTPSPPISVRIEEYHDEETDFSMGKLIRQASLNKPAGKNRSKAQPAKVVSPVKSTRNPALGSPKSEGSKKMLKPQFHVSPIKTQKSLSGSESSQFQGLRDLASDFDNKCLIKEVSSKQEEETMVEHEDKKGNGKRRLQRSETAIPKWAETMSAEDMKAQLKFWARAVASNVRQEC